MPEILVATPLNDSAVTRPYEFKEGVSIRKLSPILWASSLVEGFMPEREREELERVGYWLCAAKEVERPTEESTDDLYSFARFATSAAQIICPSGGKNVFLKLWRTKEGYNHIGILRPTEMEGTLLGRSTFLEDQGLSIHFEQVHSGVKRAFQGNCPVVRRK